MHAKEETTTIRKLKRGIRNVRKKAPNPAEVAKASKEFFFGVSGDKFTSHSRFKTDMSKISKSGKNKLSSILGQADLSFIQMLKDEENLDSLREIDEFPVPTEILYNNPAITDGQLGKGVKITVEFEKNKVRRNIDVSTEVHIEEDDEDKLHDEYKKLHEKLRIIESKYKKPADEIADIFVKVSGDLDNLERYFQGDHVVLWSYLEDLALTKSEDSMEYKCLLESKGKGEIEKRKKFLLRSEQEAEY
mmetsp:Transcript_30006/g.26578  ORF Transcript_30006/g.26578 Transcript_30006/m.26578 type:complete len:247 (+) Transcript_30006:97-837(+)